MATMRTDPASRRAWAQDERVAPVVSTSSTRRALRGTSPRVPMTGGWPMRCARRFPTWRPPPLRTRQGRSGAPRRSASAAASSPAGSNPRRNDRSRAAGTGTTVPPSRSRGASQRMRSAISSATGSRRRNFSPLTRSRATPSCGAEDQARSTPAGPAPEMEMAAARRRAQRVQTTSRGGHERPQAAHSGGTSPQATACRSSTVRSCGLAARAWRAVCQKSVKPQ